MSLDLKSKFSQFSLKDGENVVYEFEGFRLDAANLMLSKSDGEEIDLSRKKVETLLALVEHAGEIVSKDALMDRLWPDAFVEESNLVQNIHVLRKILGDAASGKPLIETLPRRGYRFIMPVSITGEVGIERKHAENISEQTSSARSPGAAQRNTRIVLFTFGFLSAVFLLILLSFNFRSVGSEAIRTVAVLPLKPIDPSTRDVAYDVGIADSLINRLGSISGLIVRPLSATRKYSDLEYDPITAGREQKVDYVLAASYQFANGKIRVTTQLFEIESGRIEATQVIERVADDNFAIQDEIAIEVGNMLSARFGATKTNPLAKRGTMNGEAYRLYLQGINLTGLDTKKAVEYFEQALKLDPNFARAYSGIARAYMIAGMGGGGLRGAHYQHAKDSVTKAFELDNDLAEAHAVRGEFRLKYDWDLPGAEKDLLHAIDLEPNDHLAHLTYAMLLAYRGSFDKALAEIDTTLAIAPDNSYYQWERARILYYARRYDEAVEQLTRLVEAGERAPDARAYLWLIHEIRGDTKAAYEMFIRNQEDGKNEHLEDYRAAYVTAGWKGVRLKLLEYSKVNEEATGSNLFAIARQFALLGDKEKAFEYLERAFERRQFQMVMLKVEPPLDLLRSDPRFDDLVRRVGLN